MRLLVVDDEKEVAEFLAEEFRKHGFVVDVALSGEAALEQIRLNRPHVMLLDIRMPAMDGIETLRRAKKIDPILGVVMVTAVKDEETIQRATALGACGYITKPFDVENLNQAVMAKIAAMTA